MPCNFKNKNPTKDLKLIDSLNKDKQDTQQHILLFHTLRVVGAQPEPSPRFMSPI